LVAQTVLAVIPGGGVLLRRDAFVAGFVAPRALPWAAGHPPDPGDAEVYRQCLAAWRAAGLLGSDDGECTAGVPDRSLPVRARALAGSYPVLVVAVSAGCGFCQQLAADLAANATRLARLHGTVLFTGPDGTAVHGVPLTPEAREALTGLGPDLAASGTPTGLLITPDTEVRLVSGYLEVTRELTVMSGADPDMVVCEQPSSCAVTIGAAPVDTMTAVAAGPRLVGVAARGPDAAELAAALPAPASGQGTYLPVTVLAERPLELFLLYRGGGLAARARTASQALDLLRQITAGFAPPPPGQFAVQCGAVISPGGQALLYPPSWITTLVKNSTRLTRAGWLISPAPLARLRPAGSDGIQLITPAGPAAVTGILAAHPGRHQPGPRTRARLHCQVINWIARPATEDAITTWAQLSGALPIHLGDQEQALAYLTASRPAPAPG
jgi:hypothetical protein